MITISRNTDVQLDLFDQVWFITNTSPNMPIGAFHHKELSPNARTFTSYKNGEIPVETLLQEYEEDLRLGKYNKALDNLLKVSSSGKWLQLVCYCVDMYKCHRYVLYRYLTEVLGEEVSIL